MADVRAQLASFPPTSTLWKPSDGQSRDDWMRCHGQPADACRRTRDKLGALKKLLASSSDEKPQQPQPVGLSASQQVIN